MCNRSKKLLCYQDLHVVFNFQFQTKKHWTFERNGFTIKILIKFKSTMDSTNSKVLLPQKWPSGHSCSTASTHRLGRKQAQPRAHFWVSLRHNSSSPSLSHWQNTSLKTSLMKELRKWQGFFVMINIIRGPLWKFAASHLQNNAVHSLVFYEKVLRLLER